MHTVNRLLKLKSTQGAVVALNDEELREIVTSPHPSLSYFCGQLFAINNSANGYVERDTHNRPVNI